MYVCKYEFCIYVCVDKYVVGMNVYVCELVARHFPWRALARTDVRVQANEKSREEKFPQLSPLLQLLPLLLLSLLLLQDNHTNCIELSWWAESAGGFLASEVVAGEVLVAFQKSSSLPGGRCYSSYGRSCLMKE